MVSNLLIGLLACATGTQAVDDARSEPGAGGAVRVVSRQSSTLEPTATMPYRITVTTEGDAGVRETVHGTHLTVGWPTGAPRQFLELHWDFISPGSAAWGPRSFQAGPFPWSADNSGQLVAQLPIGDDMWTLRCHAAGAEAPRAWCTEILRGVRVERVPSSE